MITKRSSLLPAIGLFALAAIAQLILETSADARAGGGRAAGSRGSRSFQSPSRPTQPAAPQREAIPQQPQQPLSPGPQPGVFMRGLGTALLGGFLGSMLFSGLANAGGFGGLGGSGFGMVEFLRFAGLAYFLYRRFSSSRAAVAPGYGSMQYQDEQGQTTARPSYSSQPPVQEPLPLNGIDYRSLTMMDRSFDADRFLKNAQDIFFQSAGRLKQAGHRDITLALRHGSHQKWERRGGETSRRRQHQRN